ncbi:hypothetical protein COLO4_20684 [Corchorus olitorius]|uniref:FAF domain-containing protein n=1 Tax=Corchorus olitorius TaxID=93759 RepID=A0A1R3IXP6_9ROSI|nr:hypothetical protein COLO4_20684 [Corchorus olitorius]
MSSIDPQNTDMSGWSMLQSLANANTKNSTYNKVYVHPLVKRSFSKQGEKSLAMCTESLGNETGSGVCEIDMSLLSLEIPESNNVTKLSESLGRGKMCSNFPPPLTSSSNGVQLRSRQQGGWLLVEAVKMSPHQCIFMCKEK